LPCFHLFHPIFLAIVKDAAYFISDAHLGLEIVGGEKREAALLDFLAAISSRAGQLFIVGDLFDFWIEYRRAIRPDYFPVLAALSNLVRSGTEIHYCLGNHDFAVGAFMEETIGIKVHPEGFEGVVQGKQIYVIHGDDLRPGDRATRVLRRILTNRALQTLYKTLHPDLGVPLGEAFSRLSRNYLISDPSPEILAVYRAAAGKLLAAGHELVIAGHTHVPELCALPGGLYCNTGSWIRRYCYALMEEGKIGLWTHLPGRPPLPLQPE
jgi:UDP-2,3-diacylglucosamine hydrolase